MEEIIYQCKGCESECTLKSKADSEGNSWDPEVLDGQLCSCSKWEIRSKKRPMYKVKCPECSEEMDTMFRGVIPLHGC